jgi:hypothetical protein
MSIARSSAAIALYPAIASGLESAFRFRVAHARNSRASEVAQRHAPDPRLTYLGSAPHPVVSKRSAASTKPRASAFRTISSLDCCHIDTRRNNQLDSKNSGAKTPAG